LEGLIAELGYDKILQFGIAYNTMELIQFQPNSVMLIETKGAELMSL